WIKADSCTKSFPIGIGLDIVNRVECLADDRLRQGREARSVRHPGRIVQILSKGAPLEAAPKLQAQLGRWDDCLCPVKERRGHEAIHPDRALGLVPVTERLIEDTGVDLEIVVEKQLPHRDWQLELSAGALRETGFDFAYERYPIIKP